LNNGKAMDTWRAMIAAHHGDPDATLPTATHQHTVMARETGVLSVMDARAIGEAAWRLGAGRQVQGQPVQPTDCIRLHDKPGDAVTAGQPLMTLYTVTPEVLEPAAQLLVYSIDTVNRYLSLLNV